MMIEMKERMTCLNSILADREAPFTLEYCQRWKNNCMLEAYQLVNPKKNCSPTIFYGAWYEDDDESVADFLMKLFEENSASLDVSPYVSPEFILYKQDSVSGSHCTFLSAGGNRCAEAA